MTLSRREDVRFLSGKGAFGDDIIPDNALRGVFVRSPFAHAKINGIDVAAALACDGVVAVITGQDLLAAGLGSVEPICMRYQRDGSPMFIPPRLSLTADFARFVGDPIVFVIATNRHAAEDGAEAVEIDWDERGSVTDTVAATQSDSAQVWPEVPGNIAYDWQDGKESETELALASAPHVTQLKLRISRTTAAPMEPRSAIAEYDETSDHYRLTTGAQVPWQVRKLVCEQVLHIPLEKLDVVVPDVGGGFGLKGQTFPEFGLMLYAAKLLGRPIHWQATRSEALLSDDQGRDVEMTGWLGIDASGKFTALKMDGVTALGAYLSTRGTLTTADNIPGITGTYDIPTCFARMRGVYSHTGSISPYRGAGRPEASLFIERLVDKCARETGRDPVSLRQINFLAPDELPCVTPLGFTFDSGDFPEVFNQALELADYAGFPARRKKSEEHRVLRGIGVASVIARSAANLFEAARMTLLQDGQLLLACGATTQGQGHEAVFPQIATEILGVDAGRIDYISGRSDLFELAVGTFGSRSAGIAGPAVRQATHDLIEALKPEAARLLNTASDQVQFTDGSFSSTGGETVSLADIARRLDDPLSCEAKFAPKAATFPNGGHVCEVEIDRETGLIKMVSYVTVEDVGTVLHPAIVKGQVHGGIVQGLGQAMSEQIAFDPETGQPITGSFMDFAMPRAADFPFFQVASHPVPTANNPLGVKGAGEGGTIGSLPAFQNAVINALSPLGITDVPMPATSNAIWKLISNAENS